MYVELYNFETYFRLYNIKYIINCVIYNTFLNFKNIFWIVKFIIHF